MRGDRVRPARRTRDGATGRRPYRPSSIAAQSAERRSTLEDQQSVAVTIYNEDLALVKEARRVVLDAGRNRLALRDVSARMRPETAQLRSLSNPGAFDLLEQNFDFDLLTPAKLLEKYIGRTVRVIRTNPATGVETVESAQVLATTQGTVLQIGDRIETGVPGRIVFDGVPPNLRDRPTLVTELQNRVPGTQDVELTYLSGGLSWQADYVAELSPDDSALDLNGWVTLTNRSGTAYPRRQAAAGRRRRQPRAAGTAPDRTASPMPKLAMSAAASPMVQETLFEYHLYTLQRPTTLTDNQTKQVALLNAAAVPVEKELLLNGRRRLLPRRVSATSAQKLKTSVSSSSRTPRARASASRCRRAWSGSTSATARAMRSSSARTASTTRRRTRRSDCAWARRST